MEWKKLVSGDGERLDSEGPLFRIEIHENTDVLGYGPFTVKVGTKHSPALRLTADYSTMEKAKTNAVSTMESILIAALDEIQGFASTGKEPAAPKGYVFHDRYDTPSQFAVLVEKISEAKDRAGNTYNTPDNIKEAYRCFIPNDLSVEELFDAAETFVDYMVGAIGSLPARLDWLKYLPVESEPDPAP